MDSNIFQQNYKISRNKRKISNGHVSFLIFFTGLSGSGKSTIANALEQKLFDLGIKTYVLDGDNIRRGINKGLTFSAKDRSENNRRIGEIAKLFIDAGIVVLAAFVAPYRKDRDFIKQAVGGDNYVEVYVSTSLEVCEKRDIKGLYKKARSGEINNMTGISAPYEHPENPDVEVNEEFSVETAANHIFEQIKTKLKN